MPVPLTPNQLPAAALLLLFGAAFAGMEQLLRRTEEGQG